MDDRTRTKRLPDGSTLRVSFHGEPKKTGRVKATGRGELASKNDYLKAGAVTIDGQSFRVGDKLDAQRTIVAITAEKVQLEDSSGLGSRHEKTKASYKHNSPKLVAIKKRGDKEGR